MELTRRQIPEWLLPDDNHQFLIQKPFELVFNPDKPLPDDLFNADPSILVQPELDQWFLYDSWDIKLACKLITLGYPIWLEGYAEMAKDWPEGCEGLDRFWAMVTVYNRAFSIANSSVKAGTIKEHDTPANWMAWAEGKGYSVAHLIPVDTPAATTEVVADTTPTANDDPDKALADLFDHMPVEALEKMFPANGKWKGWADKAKANALIDARGGRAMFNPYKAGMWFLNQGVEGWDLARINRVLVKNLPARSKDESYKLTGELP